MGQSGSTVNGAYSAAGGCTATTVGTPTSYIVAATKHPFPPHFNCAAKGTINSSKASAAAIATYTSASCQPTYGASDGVWFRPSNGLDFCSAQCASHQTINPKCVSFEYSSSTDTCFLYSKALTTMNLKRTPNNKAAPVHYNRACYSSRTVVSTPTATHYNWCTATPSLTVTLTDPDVSYPNRCLADKPGTNDGNGDGDTLGSPPPYTDNLNWNIAPPFEVNYFSVTSNNLVMSTAGGVLINGDRYFPNFYFDLPNAALPDPNLGAFVLFPLWQGQQVNNHTAQAMSYSIVGDEGARVLTMSWRTANQDNYADYSGTGTERYDYSVVYEEANPGVYELRYNTVTDGGVRATVGAQYSDQTTGVVDPLQWSFEEAKLSPSLTLTLDTTQPTPSFVASDEVTSDAP